MQSELKVGDKVVPVSKSVWGNLESSTSWKIAKHLNQPFLFVTGFEDSPNAIICDYVLEDSGDYFLESDLIHYVEPKK